MKYLLPRPATLISGCLETLSTTPRLYICISFSWNPMWITFEPYMLTFPIVENFLNCSKIYIIYFTILTMFKSAQFSGIKFIVVQPSPLPISRRFSLSQNETLYLLNPGSPILLLSVPGNHYSTFYSNEYDYSMYLIKVESYTIYPLWLAHFM